MRQYLKNEVFKISKWIEFYLSALIAIAVIGGGIWMIKDLIAILSSNPDSDAVYQFVLNAFNLVICVEFIKMLCRHTASTLVEVLMFAIARQMIAQHTSPVENLLCIFSIAVLFIIRKYFLDRFEDIDKTVFLPNQKIAKVNELVHVNIPEEYKGESIGEAVLKGIDLENEEVKCGQVKEVEVIRSRNVNIMPNL